MLLVIFVLLYHYVHVYTPFSLIYNVYKSPQTLDYSVQQCMMILHFSLIQTLDSCIVTVTLYSSFLNLYKLIPAYNRECCIALAELLSSCTQHIELLSLAH